MDLISLFEFGTEGSRRETEQGLDTACIRTEEPRERERERAKKKGK